MDEWDERLLVVLDAELLQLEIPVRLVVTVGFGGEIVGADRHAAIVEPRTLIGIE